MPSHKLAIAGGLLWLEGRFEAGTLLLADGRIEAVLPEHESVAADYQRINAAGLIVAPGFIDLLTHGAFGHAPESDPQALARALPQSGVTCFLPSLLSNPLPVMLAAARAIALCVGFAPGSARIAGIHAEGPFFNPRYGGQKPENTSPPTPENIEALLAACGGALRQVTLAPELPGALAAIRRLRALGVVVSLGHSEADAATYRAARDAGITHATHIMNALGQTGVGAAYGGVRPTGLEEWLLTDDGLTVDLISDRTGVHVSPEWQKIVLRCKGLDRVALVSDAMPCAGLPAGMHTTPDGQRVQTRDQDDVATLEGGLLYGSTLTLDRALRNVIAATGIPLAEALRLVTLNPARIQGLESTHGSLAAGKLADVVLFDEAITIQRTFVGGIEVYTRGGAAHTTHKTHEG